MSGVPVVAVSRPEGIVAAAFRRRSRKIYEVYDRLMYAAIGQQSDVESLRVAAIDFAHREGFQRSEQDVTVQRVVNALSQPIKSAFANFQSAPWVGKALFMEVCEAPEGDRYYCLEYDGDFVVDSGWSWLAGSAEAGDRIAPVVAERVLKAGSVQEAVEGLRAAVLAGMAGEGAPDDPALVEGLTFEAALLQRHAAVDRRFRILAGDGDR